MNFQILAFQHDQGFSTLRPNGNYYLANHPNDRSMPPENGATLDYMLNVWPEMAKKSLDHNWIKIYSVKRLEDSTYFTIGDYVKDASYEGTISEFHIDGMGDMQDVYWITLKEFDFKIGANCITKVNA